MRTMKNQVFSKLLTIIFVCCLASCVASCTTFNAKIKSLDEMTPREKAVLAMSIYSDMKEDYELHNALPDLSMAEKKILNAKYKTLKNTWPAIDIYYRASTDPTVTVTEEVIKQVNDFITTYRY